MTATRRYIRLSDLSREDRERLVLIGDGSKATGKLVAGCYPVTRQMLRYELNRRCASSAESVQAVEHIKALLVTLDTLDAREEAARKLKRVAGDARSAGLSVNEMVSILRGLRL